MIPNKSVILKIDINCNTHLGYEVYRLRVVRVQIFLPRTLYGHFMPAIMKKKPENLDKNDTKGLKL